MHHGTSYHRQCTICEAILDDWLLSLETVEEHLSLDMMLLLLFGSFVHRKELFVCWQRCRIGIAFADMFSRGIKALDLAKGPLVNGLLRRVPVAAYHPNVRIFFMSMI